jgi:hypothetical protein
MSLDGELHPRAVALRTAREEVIARLSDGFARDELSLEELERRVDGAYAALDVPELQGLVADLGALGPMAPMARVPVAPAPLAQPASRLALAVFGNVERRVSAVVPGARVSAIFGNVELDLRDLALPAGITQIDVRAVCGNVELTISPTLAVECVGASVLGSFASVHRVPRGAADEPVLRIVGAALLGNVEVKTLPSRARLELARRELLAPPDPER